MIIAAVIELGRVVEARQADNEPPQIIVRGERTKVLYLAYPDQMRPSPGVKTFEIGIGDRVVVERGDPFGGKEFYLSEWSGEDEQVDEEMAWWIDNRGGDLGWIDGVVGQG